MTRATPGLRVREDERRRASIQEAMLGDESAARVMVRGPLYELKGRL